MTWHKISTIPDKGSKGLTIKLGESEVKIIAVRLGNTIYCYRNICPHTGVNLEWLADQFLDISGELIQCATHGALFRIKDGFCISGPCAGQNLIPLKVNMDGDLFEILPA